MLKEMVVLSLNGLGNTLRSNPLANSSSTERVPLILISSTYTLLPTPCPVNSNFTLKSGRPAALEMLMVSCLHWVVEEGVNALVERLVTVGRLEKSLEYFCTQ